MAENTNDVNEPILSVTLRKNAVSRERFRREVLASLGAVGSEIDELLAYGCSRFAGMKAPALPLPDEPFVAVWRDYAEEAAERGVFPVLREKLVQLRFPIRDGISRKEDYRAATLRGIFPCPAPTAMEPVDPEGLKLFLHETPVGTIPVLTVRNRSDFVALVRALSMRNEPGPVPESMGATMIAGINNWDRIERYRRAWEADHPAKAAGGGWPAEFSRLIPRKEDYRDRLIILSEGGYSNVAAEKVGMTDDVWRRASLVIRLEHECAHYFTSRAFGSMQDAVHDELIAERAGIAAAAGAFRADWFLLFMGLENYLGNPPPCAASFGILTRLVKEAAENLERFEAGIRAAKGASAPGPTSMLLALAALHMEELASPDAARLLEEEFAQTERRR